MYRREYVRKRKRRRIVAIVGAACSVVVLSFAIIAFLGRFVGTFTVSLESRNVDLTLLEKKDSTYSTSFLRVNSLVPFQEFTYSYFDNYGGDEVIDSEESGAFIGANYSPDDPTTISSLNFFKYTYFVKNVGKVPAMYDWSVKVTDNVLSPDGRSLLDTLRVTIYVDGVKKVYGKALSTPRYDSEGKADYCPPISVDKQDATDEFPFMGYVNDVFTSSEVITTFREENLDVNESRRYTIVAWLEGFRSSNEEFAPRGATIKLGVEINAYEIQ